MLRFLVQIALLLLVTGAAWYHGERSEKHVSAIYCALVFLGALYGWLAGGWSESETVLYYRVALDVLVLAAVLHLALRASRWWVLWVASAQLLAVLAHLLRLAQLMPSPLIYQVMERWPVWVAIIVTGIGTMQSYRRRNHRLPYDA